ncbi:TPA: GPO family capsid scaffolding protein [Burkholderia vietnamiensis]|nr:GPO family capsid scaffolding protein [Burkholderia vietnamiensis]
MAIGSLGSSAADATKLAKSKMFRIAVEGGTTDGRVIERSWLEQIAKNYSATKYGARVNLEHIRGLLPDGPFKAYGDVIAVETRELDGEFAGKLGLFAQIDPTAELVAMNKARQKIYTSCEIDTAFADTSEAYLVGLAVTDSPASLGTDALSFSAKNPAVFSGRKLSPTNLFTEALETVIEFEEAPQSAALPALLSRVKELLTGAKKKDAADASRFADVEQACEALATHGNEQAASIAALTKQVAELNAAREADRKAFDELHVQLSKTESGVQRPASTGSAGGTVTTDC